MKHLPMVALALQILALSIMLGSACAHSNGSTTFPTNDADANPGPMCCAPLDAAPAGPVSASCAAACAALARAGCATGAAPLCGQVMQGVEDHRSVPRASDRIPVRCDDLVNATDPRKVAPTLCQ
jgi:hypothetical protein